MICATGINGDGFMDLMTADLVMVSRQLCWCLWWGYRLLPQLNSRGLKGEEFRASHGYANV